MSNYHDVACRWVDNVTGGTGKVLTSQRVIPIGDSIFSYGRHFEMARAIRDDAGETIMFLINGDTWSSSTSHHQSTVRSAIEATRMPSVIIPYRALNAAGIDRDDVRILHVTEPTYTTHEHAAFARPKHFEYKQNTWTEELADGRTQYGWQTTRHWLGEALIQARIAYTVQRTCKVCRGSGRTEGPVDARWVAPRQVTQRIWIPDKNGPYGQYVHFDTGITKAGFWDQSQFDRPPCPDCRGRGRWLVTRHRSAKFLSGFDRNEARRSYFFCELPPKSEAVTVEQAYAALKPDTVKLAEQMGRQVRRQGDIFAIPITATNKRALRKAGARFERRGSLFNTNHVATEVAYLPDGNTLVRGVISHDPAGRRPDHARVRLDEGWHLVVKNTVPIAA